MRKMLSSGSTTRLIERRPHPQRLRLLQLRIKQLYHEAALPYFIEGASDIEKMIIEQVGLQGLPEAPGHTCRIGPSPSRRTWTGRGRGFRAGLATRPTSTRAVPLRVRRHLQALGSTLVGLLDTFRACWCAEQPLCSTSTAPWQPRPSTAP